MLAQEDEVQLQDAAAEVLQRLSIDPPRQAVPMVPDWPVVNLQHCSPAPGLQD